MNNEHQIFDSPMPEDRNFHWLKAKGLEYVQQLDGTQWTNFNDSDPGVTILEQLCYALTELGYCNNFPIEDTTVPKLDPQNFSDRDKIKKRVESQTNQQSKDYKMLRNLRNALAHGVRSDLAEVQRALSSKEKLDTELNRLFKTLLPK